MRLGVRDQAAGVDHARAQEEGVVVVAGVVGGAHLGHVLRAGVEEGVFEEGEDEEAAEGQGEGGV